MNFEIQFLEIPNLLFYHDFLLLYSAKLWQGKTLTNRSFQSFGEESFGKLTIANISYFSNLEFSWLNISE